MFPTLILKALQQGLDGVVLKVDDMDGIIKLKVFSHKSFQSSAVIMRHDEGLLVCVYLTCSLLPHIEKTIMVLWK
jgi:hypothetical protein